MTAEELYHGELLRLARARLGSGRLASPDATAERDNPLCGDDVAMDVRSRAR